METKTDKLYLENQKIFESWFDTINNYVNFRKSDYKIDELSEKVDLLVDEFDQVSKILIKFGQFKDNFSSDTFLQTYLGIELDIISVKTSSNIIFGLDNSGIFLKTHLRNNYNIKNMDDKFWINLLSLYNYGSFSLERAAGFSKDVKKDFPDLFLTQKSVVFNIFRKYFVDILLEKEEYRKYDIVGDFGELKVSWDSNFSSKQIIKELLFVFKTMYNLNYSLWKIDDLSSKRQKNFR